MSKRLEGKVALVTGGTSGIGAGTVRRLAREGARVLFTGSKAEAAAALAGDTGATFVAHKVQDAAAWPALMSAIADKFGRLDIAFANAGVEGLAELCRRLGSVGPRGPDQAIGALSG